MTSLKQKKKKQNRNKQHIRVPHIKTPKRRGSFQASGEHQAMYTGLHFGKD